ncbi:hypothetical protein RKE29_13085 [Streptomyces sp. B1866]|uniref:hypothetical protein n=1 Tax=Streptomyces sp. B1866 TaxID=3075431 RepID=UPI00289128DF|nr:hypothetical protein [Streptomyces sp. B1866]MDT3397574.1 hypothetical protein [Streptomyces sp. B1866]
MSQNWQPPQQQPGPYPPPGAPGAYPPPPPAPYGGGFPPPPAPARPANPALALLAAVVAALVGAGVYAGILFGLADTDKGEITRVAYIGIGVGALVGLAVGKLGGRNVGLWVVGAALALAAVLLGELYGYALIYADGAEKAAEQLSKAGAPQQIDAPSANEIFFDHFKDLWKSWKEDLEGWEYLFMALAPIATVGTAFRLNKQR